MKRDKDISVSLALGLFNLCQGAALSVEGPTPCDFLP